MPIYFWYYLFKKGRRICKILGLLEKTISVHIMTVNKDFKNSLNHQFHLWYMYAEEVTAQLQNV